MGTLGMERISISWIYFTFPTQKIAYRPQNHLECFLPSTINHEHFAQEISQFPKRGGLQPTTSLPARTLMVTMDMLLQKISRKNEAC